MKKTEFKLEKCSVSGILCNTASRCIKVPGSIKRCSEYGKVPKCNYSMNFLGK